MPGSFLLARNDNNADEPLRSTDEGALKIVEGISLPEWDRADLTWTNDNLTKVVCKLNGAVVATVDMTYDGEDNVTSIVKS